MPQKALNIFVAGGFDEKDPNALNVKKDEIVCFASQLGAQIIEQGHTLVGGCQTDVDKIVALAAAKQLGNGQTSRIVSYVQPGITPVHKEGVQIQSSVSDWNFGGKEPTPPEVVAYADVVILLGGFFGTFQAANWARLAAKPVLPFAIFGGASQEVFNVESGRFDDIYEASIDRLEYEQVLKPLSYDWQTDDWQKLAHLTISLAEKIVTTPDVFVIMSYSKSGQYKDLYASIKRVCVKYEYEARRVDEANLFKRIIPEIMRRLRKSAYVIADVTEAKPNVFYELGIAEGLGKEIILTAKAETQLPFDINDFPVIFWDSFEEFEEQLEKRVNQIGSWQGRA